MNQRSIYPWVGLRQGGIYSNYADIAIEHYYFAKQGYNELLRSGTEAYNLCGDIRNNSIISTVFSAMCIESFLNNYAAACLGDDDFYGNFDKLSPEGKLQLIAMFILKVQIDKGASYYCHLKRLFKDRNMYVHNKSRGYSWEEICRIHNVTPMPLDEINDLYEHPENYELVQNSEEQWKQEKEYIASAQNGIKAMRDIATFFDTHDDTAYAISQLFNPNFNNIALEPTHPFNRVLSDFNIQYEKITEK